jgi:hypothetical protein
MVVVVTQNMCGQDLELVNLSGKTVVRNRHVTQSELLKMQKTGQFPDDPVRIKGGLLL